MLAMEVNVGERVLIDGGRIVVQVVRVYRHEDGVKVRLAFAAPREVPILREELALRGRKGAP